MLLQSAAACFSLVAVVPILMIKGAIITVEDMFNPAPPSQQQLDMAKYKKLAIITGGQCASPNGIGGCRYDSLQTVPEAMPAFR